MAGNEMGQADAGNSTRERPAATARDIGKQAASTAGEFRSAANDVKNAASDQADDIKNQASGIADQLKEQASQGVGDARELVSNIASEARNKVTEIVDQQKNASADRLAGLSRAAQNAAGEIEQQSPQVAQLVRDAASTVDHFAGDLRSSDLGDIVASVSSFARKQPVAFFAASVLAGFVLARFVKSEPAPVAPPQPRRRSAAR